MNQPTAYLAGPIKGTSYRECVDWREDARRSLADVGIIGLSPMRFKTYLAQEGAIADDYAEHPLCTQQGITARDRFDCQRSDVVLMNLIGADHVSIGSMIEVGWADAARRPIIAAMEPGNIHNHGMVRACAGFIVPTLADALDVCRAILVPA